MTTHMAERNDSPGRKISLTLPERIPVTDEQAEAVLLQHLKANISDADYLETLWQLVRFYQGIQRNDLVTDITQMILKSTDNPEEQARCYHWLGQAAELRREYDAALEYYAKGVTLKPTDKITAYFLRNNTGYCLNLKGRHEEAEALCLKAIEIDSAQHNAWKNLGLSLEGQGDLMGAAWAYVEATKLNPRDIRAFTFLQRLIAEHPDFARQIFWNPGGRGGLQRDD